MKFFKDLLNYCEIKLGEQINPRSELDQWMRKLTFQHKAGDEKVGLVWKHRHAAGCWAQMIIKNGRGQLSFNWRRPHGTLLHVGAGNTSIKIQRSQSQFHLFFFISERQEKCPWLVCARGIFSPRLDLSSQWHTVATATLLHPITVFSRHSHNALWKSV